MSGASNILSIVAALAAILCSLINLNIPIVNDWFVHRTFTRFREGVFCIQLAGNQILKFGDISLNNGQCDNTMIIVNQNEAYAGLLQGSIGIGRTYAEGHWKAKDDLGDLLTHLLWNLKTTAQPFSTFARYLRVWDWKQYFNRLGIIKYTTIRQMHRIQESYFNADFYKYILDERCMAYSCGAWNESTSSLCEAQINQIEVILHKLKLHLNTDTESTTDAEQKTQTQNILEIGSAYGFVSSYIRNKSASNSNFDSNPNTNVVNVNVNVNVTAITLNEAKHRYSQQAFGPPPQPQPQQPQAQAQNHSPHFLNLGFGRLPSIYGANYFDGIISIGGGGSMQSLLYKQKRVDEWFHKLYAILKPGAYFVMQTVVATQAHSIPVQDSYFTDRKKACMGYNFVSRYMFPDGCVVPGGWIQESANRAGFVNRHREYMGEHYVRTFYEWRSNLMRHKQRLLHTHARRSSSSSGNNAGLLQLFEFYLAFSESAFRTGIVEDAQFVFYKPKDLLPRKIVYTQKYADHDLKESIHLPILDNYHQSPYERKYEIEEDEYEYEIEEYENENEYADEYHYDGDDDAEEHRDTEREHEHEHEHEYKYNSGEIANTLPSEPAFEDKHIIHEYITEYEKDTVAQIVADESAGNSVDDDDVSSMGHLMAMNTSVGVGHQESSNPRDEEEIVEMEMIVNSDLSTSMLHPNIDIERDTNGIGIPFEFVDRAVDDDDDDDDDENEHEHANDRVREYDEHAREHPYQDDRFQRYDDQRYDYRYQDTLSAPTLMTADSALLSNEEEQYSTPAEADANTEQPEEKEGEQEEEEAEEEEAEEEYTAEKEARFLDIVSSLGLASNANAINEAVPKMEESGIQFENVASEELPEEEEEEEEEKESDHDVQEELMVENSLRYNSMDVGDSGAHLNVEHLHHQNENQNSIVLPAMDDMNANSIEEHLNIGLEETEETIRTLPRLTRNRELHSAAPLPPTHAINNNDDNLMMDTA